MAKHLAPSKEKKQFKLPSIPTDKLPRVVDFRFGKEKKRYPRDFSLRAMIPVLMAALLFLLGFLLGRPLWVKVLLLGASALCSGFDPVRRTLQRVLNRKWPDEDLFFLAAAIIAFCIGEYAAGAFALLMVRAGELVQGYVLARTDNGVELLRQILPEKAFVLHGDEAVETMPENVQVGDLLQVPAGERIPVDGELVSGVSTVDCAPLCGENSTVNVAIGSKLRAGCVNLSAPITMRAEKSFAESAAALRLESFEQARALDSILETRLNRYAAIYTAVIAVCALLLGVLLPIFTHDWAGGLRRALLFLLLSSPSALLISVPLCFEGAMLSAERKGVRIFGKSVLERLSHVKTMAFGKTGVITDGKFRVTDVFPDGVGEEELLGVAAAAESHARNPMGEALRQAGGWTRDIADGVLQIEEVPGRGVSAFIEGRHVYVGNAALMEEHGIFYLTPTRAGSAVHVAVEDRYWGHILLSDKLRDGAFDALEDLRAQGVKQMVMLTGDVLSVSKNIAAALNFDMVRSELTPEGKLSAIRYLLQGLGDRDTLAYVGDGIHDAPLFQGAHVGIAMDALRYDDGNEKADVSVMSGEIRRLPMLMRIARTAMTGVWQNILFCCGLKALMLILTLTGHLPIAFGAAGEALIMTLTALNALRIYTVE